MRNILAILVFNACCFNSFGQVDQVLLPFNSNVVDRYLEYYSLPREHVYTHFNKSCYLPGDDIWFECYVFDPATSLPGSVSLNLYVELYNPNGKLCSQKILFIGNGRASYVFSLEQASMPGKYTFRAYTNWMKNFGLPYQLISFIQVLGDQTNVNENTNQEYDVQFFPESGTFLEGCLNTIAVKVLDQNGQGVKAKGEILNFKNDTLTTFELNELGMGSFSLFAKESISFSCNVHFPNGKTIEYPLPTIETKGLITKILPLFEDKVRVIAISNQASIESEMKFFIAIHSNGLVCKTGLFYLSPKNTTALIDIKKEELINGVNCLTIFNEEFQPVAERIFFVRNEEIHGSLNIESKYAGDTISLNLLATDSKGLPEAAALSLSVLPSGTVSNKFTNSLLAEILLESGIKGYIENPQYYFEIQNYDRQRDLDALLMTQGWRKYDWKEILQDKIGQPLYDAELGFTIEGEVKNWIKGKSEANTEIVLTSPQNNVTAFGEVDSTGKFQFINLLFTDSTGILLTALDKNGKGWNRSITAKQINIYSPDSLINTGTYYSFRYPISEPSSFSIIPDFIELKEVEIISKKAEKASPFKDSFFGPKNGKYVEITQENYTRYTCMENLLKREFNIDMHIEDLDKVTVDMHRGPSSLSRDIQPVLIINDIPMTDLSYLATIPLNDIEVVAINKSVDYNLGSGGGGGSILIKTRIKPFEWDKAVETNRKYIKLQGYAPPIAYYSPKYTQLPSSQVYANYAAIFWAPNIKTDADGKATIQFFVPKGLNGLEMRFEGISSIGTIFLDEFNVSLE